MSVTPLIIPGSARFHLLLAYDPDKAHQETFGELVAANEVIEHDGDWLVSSDSALEVSSVEADARMARWSRKTGGLAVRITRPDPTRWWLAVHHDGQRLFAMIHTHEVLGATGIPGALITDAELGRDPLLDLASPTSTRGDVGEERGRQLAAALAVGGLDIDEHRLIRLLRDEKAADGNLPDLLDVLGAAGAWDLGQSSVPAFMNSEGLASVRSVMSRAVLLGCVMPGFVSIALFITFSRFAVRSGASPAIALLFGGFVAWLGLAGLRRFVGVRMPTTAGPMGASPRNPLGWAGQGPAEARPPRPTAAALETWGGLFYLLRDIAFFAGIERPTGPSSLYIEAWGMGPASLVEGINRVAAKDTPPEPLYDVAAGLVKLREELIDQHLIDAKIQASGVKQRVRTILGQLAS
ncbi:MAG: hypothetical protein ACI9WU_004453 [Myxococcota bacterium]|jgi:hypothetical protein